MDNGAEGSDNLEEEVVFANELDSDYCDESHELFSTLNKLFFIKTEVEAIVNTSCEEDDGRWLNLRGTVDAVIQEIQQYIQSNSKTANERSTSNLSKTEAFSEIFVEDGVQVKLECENSDSEENQFQRDSVSKRRRRKVQQVDESASSQHHDFGNEGEDVVLPTTDSWSHSDLSVMQQSFTSPANLQRTNDNKVLLRMWQENYLQLLQEELNTNIFSYIQFGICPMTTDKPRSLQLNEYAELRRGVEQAMIKFALQHGPDPKSGQCLGQKIFRQMVNVVGAKAPDVFGDDVRVPHEFEKSICNIELFDKNVRAKFKRQLSLLAQGGEDSDQIQKWSRKSGFYKKAKPKALPDDFGNKMITMMREASEHQDQQVYPSVNTSSEDRLYDEETGFEADHGETEGANQTTAANSNPAKKLRLDPMETAVCEEDLPADKIREDGGEEEENLVVEVDISQQHPHIKQEQQDQDVEEWCQQPDLSYMQQSYISSSTSAATSTGTSTPAQRKQENKVVLRKWQESYLQLLQEELNSNIFSYIQFGICPMKTDKPRSIQLNDYAELRRGVEQTMIKFALEHGPDPTSGQQCFGQKIFRQMVNVVGAKVPDVFGDDVRVPQEFEKSISNIEVFDKNVRAKYKRQFNLLGPQSQVDHHLHSDLSTQQKGKRKLPPPGHAVEPVKAVLKAAPNDNKTITVKRELSDQHLQDNQVISGDDGQKSYIPYETDFENYKPCRQRRRTKKNSDAKKYKVDKMKPARRKNIRYQRNCAPKKVKLDEEEYFGDDFDTAINTEEHYVTPKEEDWSSGQDFSFMQVNDQSYLSSTSDDQRTNDNKVLLRMWQENYLQLLQEELNTNIFSYIQFGVCPMKTEKLRSIQLNEYAELRRGVEQAMIKFALKHGPDPTSGQQCVGQKIFRQMVNVVGAKAPDVFGDDVRVPIEFEKSICNIDCFDKNVRAKYKRQFILLAPHSPANHDPEYSHKGKRRMPAYGIDASKAQPKERSDEQLSRLISCQTFDDPQIRDSVQYVLISKKFGVHRWSEMMPQFFSDPNHIREHFKWVSNHELQFEVRRMAGILNDIKKVLHFRIGDEFQDSLQVAEEECEMLEEDGGLARLGVFLLDYLALANNEKGDCIVKTLEDSLQILEPHICMLSDYSTGFSVRASDNVIYDKLTLFEAVELWMYVLFSADLSYPVGSVSLGVWLEQEMFHLPTSSCHRSKGGSKNLRIFKIITSMRADLSTIMKNEKEGPNVEDEMEQNYLEEPETSVLEPEASVLEPEASVLEPEASNLEM